MDTVLLVKSSSVIYWKKYKDVMDLYKELPSMKLLFLVLVLLLTETFSILQITEVSWHLSPALKHDKRRQCLLNPMRDSLVTSLKGYEESITVSDLLFRGLHSSPKRAHEHRVIWKELITKYVGIRVSLLWLHKPCMSRMLTERCLFTGLVHV